jgi:hypothetical protein
LVDVTEAAGILVLERASAALPVNDAELCVVSRPSGDAVEDDGAIQSAVDDKLTRAGACRGLTSATTSSTWGWSGNTGDRLAICC